MVGVAVTVGVGRKDGAAGAIAAGAATAANGAVAANGAATIAVTGAEAIAVAAATGMATAVAVATTATIIRTRLKMQSGGRPIGRPPPRISALTTGLYSLVKSAGICGSAPALPHRMISLPQGSAKAQL